MANSNLPKWYNQMPWSDFSKINLDWLIKKYGEQDSRIENIEQSDAMQNEILSDHETRITSLEGRMETAEGEIDDLQSDTSDLKTRMTTAEGEIDDLQSDTSDLKTRMTTAEGEIDDLESDTANLKLRMTAAEGAITDLTNEDTALSNRIQANSNDITALDSRVTTLEGHSVIANQGGTTSAVLSTLNVDGVNYEVPQGGGGGGSTVIPNASGTSQGDLNTIGIDGYIYDIPSGVDTSDMIAPEYDPTDYYDTGDCVIHDGVLYRALEDSITGAWDDNKWVTTTCTEIANNAADTAAAIQQMYAALGTVYEDTATGEDSTSSTTKSYLPGTRRTLTPGSWLVTYNATFDTHELGSKQRGLYTYIDVDGVVIAQGGKYMWGSEAINDIKFANSVSISAVINVPTGTTKTVTPQYRVPVNTGSGDYEIEVRVGYVCIKPIN